MGTRGTATSAPPPAERRWGLVESNETLAQRLHAVQQQVRYVYRRLVEAE